MKDTSKQAFPDPLRGLEQCQHNQDPREEEQGMTYKEWLIGQILAGNSLMEARAVYGVKCEDHVSAIIEIADEVIKQLNKE